MSGVRKVKTIAKPVKKSSKKQAAPKVITIMVDIPEGDDRTISEVVQDIKEHLTDAEGLVAAKRVTHTTSYYLVDGKVCNESDYDTTTNDFKPGAHPPLWAMASDQVKILERIEREKKGPGLAKNPEGLRTAKETDEFHSAEKRKAKTKAALDDLYENSEWGAKRKAEAAASSSAESSEDDEEEWDEEWEDEDTPKPVEDDSETVEDDDEEEWDEEDPFNEEVTDDALDEQASSALALLQGRGKTVKNKVVKTKMPRRVVRRR